MPNGRGERTKERESEVKEPQRKGGKQGSVNMEKFDPPSGQVKHDMRIAFKRKANKYAYAVSGQNKIGRELTLLALIQPTVIKQQTVNNNWL